MFNQIPRDILKYEILPYMNPWTRECVFKKMDEKTYIKLLDEAKDLLNELMQMDKFEWSKIRCAFEISNNLNYLFRDILAATEKYYSTLAIMNSWISEEKLRLGFKGYLESCNRFSKFINA